MSKKGFNKKLVHRCEYCIYGKVSSFENEVLCTKKGITNVDDSCRHYKYNPLKREPKRIKIDKDFSFEDFSL